jgi:hypothetical protein
MSGAAIFWSAVGSLGVAGGSFLGLFVHVALYAYQQGRLNQRVKALEDGSAKSGDLAEAITGLREAVAGLKSTIEAHARLIERVEGQVAHELGGRPRLAPRRRGLAPVG